MLSTAALLTACTSEVTGSPVTAAGPPPGTVDIASLDVGNYPTKPAPLGTAGTPEVGAIVEAQRMANYVTGPWEVDPTLVDAYTSSGMVMIPRQISVPALREFAEAVARFQFVNGFFSSRQSRDKTKILQNVVLRFADPAAAVAAAGEIAKLAGEKRFDIQSPPAPAPIPGHPEAVAFSSTHDSPPVTWTTVRSATARGPYVLMQQAQSTVGVAPAAELVGRTLDLQGPLIDRFAATNPADFAALPLDPTGLLARTLPIAPKEATLVQRTVYERQGALHFQADPVASTATFDRAGMDLLARAKTLVYQARDNAGAQLMSDAFVAETAAGAAPAEAVPGLPGSRCLALQGGGHFCYAVADRYLIEVNTMQLADAQQRVSAQYVMLMTG